MTRGAKRKTCRENNMMANTYCLDGRREAIKTDAIMEMFKEMLLLKVGFFGDPGAFIVQPV